MNIIFPAFLLVGASVAFVLLTLTIRRWPTIPIFASGLELLVAWDMPKEPAIASAMGFNVYVTDIISVAVLIVALLNFRQLQKTLGLLLIPWVLYVAVLAISFLNGAAQFGIGPSMNDARSFLQLAFGLTWAFSVDWEALGGVRALKKPALWLGWLLSAVAAYHGLRYGINGADSIVLLDGTETVTGRVLVSGQAMALTICAGIVASHWVLERKKLQALSTIVFALVVVVSQHRSVWVAAGVGIAGLLLVGHWRTKLRIAGVGILALGGTVALILTGALDSIVPQFIQAFTDDRSLNARTHDWPQLVGKSFELGTNAVMAGQPMGSGYVRVEPNGLIATFMPHNWYVSTFLRTGLLGSLFFWLPFAVALCLAVVKRARESPLFILIVILTYCAFYSMEASLHFFIGWALVAILTAPDRYPRVEVGAGATHLPVALRRRPQPI